MSRAVSWSVRDDDFGLREAAVEAARRAGMPLHDWLEETFRVFAADMGVRADTLDDNERAQAVARRLGRLGREDDRGSYDRRRGAEYGEGFWSRAAQAVSDLDAERFGGRAFRQRDADLPVRRRDRDDPAWREETIRRRAGGARVAVDDQDDTADGSSYSDNPRARTTRRAPGSEQAALKRELSKFAKMLTDVHESMSARGASSTEIEALRDQVADITRGIAGLAPREAITQLDQAIRELGHRLEDARNEGLVEQFVAPVEVMMGDLKRSLLAAAPTSTLESIDGRLGALMRSMESLSDAQVDPAALSTVLDQTMQIRAALDEAADNTRHVAAIEQAIADLGDRVDQLLERGRTGPGLEAIYHAIEHMRGEITRNNPSHAFEALDERLEELRHRVADALSGGEMLDRFEKIDQRLDAMHRDLAERMPELGRLEAVLGAVEASLDSRLHAEVDTSRLEAIIARLGDRLDTRAETAQLRAAIEDLSRQLEQATAESAEPHVVEGLRSQIENLSQYLNAPSREETAAARLEQMMETLAARLDAPISRRALEQVQETVRLLTERFEQAVREGGPGDAIANLEHKLAQLSAKLEDRPPAFDRAAIEDIVEAVHRRLAQAYGDIDASSMSRALEEMHEQIVQLREAASASAEIAALKAAQETLAHTNGAAAAGSLERELADLRQMQEAADLRTNATLNAVHEALEKIAERLARSKTDNEPKAQPAPRPPEPAVADRAEPTDPSAYRPSVELNFGSADSGPPLRTEPPQTPVRQKTPAPPQRHEAPTAAPSQPAAAPAAKRIGSGEEDDFLLEPGMGKPANPQSGIARKIPDDSHQSSARASFIAAVRRAQQGSGKTPDLAATRDSGAAGEADAPKNGSMAGNMLSPLRRIRRMLLIGAAVMATIFVGWQLVRPFIPNPNAAQPPPKRVSAAPQTSERTAADKTLMRALDGGQQLRADGSGDLARGPVRSLDAAAQPLDMNPVGAIPPRAVKPPPSPRDPAAMAAAGAASAQFELGARLADGRQGPRDLAKAADWFQKAAAQNFAPAQYRLGVLYEKGTGVPRDIDRAKSLYQSAAERGHVKAMHNLGSLLAEGVGGRPDYANAARWFREAAEHGVRDSQYNLAVLHARGLGIAKDLVQSYVWFATAAAQGDEDAAAKLKEIAIRLDARQLAQAKSIQQAFRPRAADRAVNDAQEPDGGWLATQGSAGGRAGPGTQNRAQRTSAL